jgi:hypothetical protein
MLLARVLNGCWCKMKAEISYFAPVPFDDVVQANVVLFLEDQEAKISSTVAASSCISTVSQRSVVARRYALRVYSTG